MRKESELCRKPFEKELRDLDILLENSLFSRRDSLVNSLVGGVNEHDVEDRKSSSRDNSEPHQNDESHSSVGNVIVDDCAHENSNDVLPEQPHGLKTSDATLVGVPTMIDLDARWKASTEPAPVNNLTEIREPTPQDSNASPIRISASDQQPGCKANDSHSSVNQDGKTIFHVEPPTPPLSSEGDTHPLSYGGIPWYMGPFDPVGTTIEEERWTGRELVRGMSEELSDMDEEELSGLVDTGVAVNTNEPADGALNPDFAGGNSSQRKVAAKRKRWRGYR